MTTILLIALFVAVMASTQQGRRVCWPFRAGFDNTTREEIAAQVADLADQYDSRLGQLESHYEARLSELEERLDFTERLLTSSAADEGRRLVRAEPNA